MSSLHPSLSLLALIVCAVRCSVVQDPDAPLTPEQIDHFLVNGYVALPGLLAEDFNDAMKRDVDRLVDDRAAKQAAPLIASCARMTYPTPALPHTALARASLSV